MHLLMAQRLLSGDKKWKVTKAGKYKLTLDLNNKKLKAEYLGA